jgi:hypothetical protein
MAYSIQRARPEIKSDCILLEGLPNFIDEYPAYAKYFKNILNHRVIDTIENNSLYIYCNYNFDNYSRLSERAIVHTIRGNVSYRSVCFEFDGPSPASKQGVSADTRIPIEVIKLSFSSRQNITVGYFIPSQETILLCDISHKSDLVSMKCLKAILNYFIVKKLIRKQPDHFKFERRLILHDIPNLKLSIGCDPEFELVMNGRVISGETHERFQFEDSSDRLYTKWGLDGARDPIEARPDPGDSPENAVNNIRELFKEVSDLHLTVAGNTYSIGGHVHLGGVDFISPLDVKFIKLLDVLIGVPCYKMNGSARRAPYNRLTEFEVKAYGFEYRSAPAAIFYTPELLRIVYKILYESALSWFSGQTIRVTPSLNINLKDIAHLTEEEIETYHRLIDEYAAIEQNVVAAWVDVTKPIVRKYKLKVIFAREDLHSSHLARYITSELQNIELNVQKKVYFYGLAEQRGVVFSGINVPHFQMIAHPCPDPTFRFGVAGLRIGLPFVLRAPMAQLEWVKWKPVIDNLITAIKECL